MREKEQQNVRISIKVNNSMDEELKAFSEIMSIPKSTLVSIVLIDGFKRCKRSKKFIEKVLYSPTERMLKGTKNSCSIKFSIAEEMYGEINKLIDVLNERKGVSVSMRSLFLGLWVYYAENVFGTLNSQITNLRSGEREIEGALDRFYKRKAIAYGVPVSNLQSFYLAQKLNAILHSEIAITDTEKRENTKLFLEPLDKNKRELD